MLGFLLELLNSNDRFFFLTYHLATYCIIFVDDVTELMFTFTLDHVVI